MFQGDRGFPGMPGMPGEKGDRVRSIAMKINTQYTGCR